MLETNVTRARSGGARRSTLSGGETRRLRHADLGGRRRCAAAVVPGRAARRHPRGARQGRRRPADRAELAAGARRAVVVGGGYIGLEAAAVLTQARLRGRRCSRCSTACSARVAGEDLSRVLRGRAPRARRRHPRSAPRSRRSRARSRVTGVRLASGETIACDIVVVGIGIVPAVGPLIAAGAAGANGVDVDEFCRTSLPDVYAIGDCAAHANRLCRRRGDPARKRAERQRHGHHRRAARSAAIRSPTRRCRGSGRTSTTCGCRPSASASATTPRCCAAIRRAAASRWSISRAARSSRSTASTATKDYAQGRKLVEARAAIAPELLLDAEVPLKELL